MKRDLSLNELNAQLDSVQFHGEPQDLWSMVMQSPALTHGIIPKVIEDLAFAEPDVFEPIAVAASAFAAVSMLVGGTHQIHVANDWWERPIIWIANCGEPSTLKSPIMKRAMRPIIEIQKDIFSNHQTQRVDRAVTGAQRPPLARQLYSNDPNIPAISELLREHSFGMGIYQDELSTFIAGFMEKQRNELHQGDYLTAYLGGPHVVNRINRGQVYVPNLAVAILGGLTLDKIYRMANSIPADGLLARFNVIIMPPSTGQISTEHISALGPYTRLIRRLYSAQSSTSASVTYTLSPKAEKYFRQLSEQYARRAQTHQSGLPRLAEHEGKLRGMVLRYAALFAAIEKSTSTIIKLPTLKRAAQWLELLMQHAYVFYSGMNKRREGPEMQLIRAIGEYVLRAGVTEFQAGDLMRHVIPEWREASTVQQHQALVMLEELDWVAADNEEFFRGNRLVKGTKFVVNPAVHTQYMLKAMEQKELAKEAVANIKRAAESRRKNRGA